MIGQAGGGTLPFVDAAEEVYSFAPGGAEQFMLDYAAASEKCAVQDPRRYLSYRGLNGFGDGGLRSVKKGAEDNRDFVIVRTGRMILVLSNIKEGATLLTDELIGKAVAKVRAG